MPSCGPSVYLCPLVLSCSCGRNKARKLQGEKYLVLKKKYRTPSLQSSDSFASALTSPDINPSPSMTSLHSMADKRSISHSTSQDSLDSATSPTRQPPPYRPPPPPVVSTPPSTPVSDAPPVPPRKKSTGSNKENSPEVTGRPTTIGAEADVEESDPENKISVKECMQKFQRMASESALQKAHLPAVKKRFEKKAVVGGYNSFVSETRECKKTVYMLTDQLSPSLQPNCINHV
ncbi:hypothetical protein J6590_026974 [Homalodisca vitripennis]|nr:hypothetical protein J6590_026974 [Homalodisca vitripennis]